MMPLTVQTICAAVGGTVLQSSGAAVRDEIGRAHV